MTTALLPKTLDEHLFAPGRKRILALDGGGVRGILTCGLLEQMEDTLKKRLPPEQQDAFRLSDYFDLIAGTSTGAIMATLLALGYSVAEIKTLYRKLAKDVFGKKNTLLGIVPQFDSRKLTEVIDGCFDDFLARQHVPDNYTMTLGSEFLRTGLLICSKRIDTGSPWILTNNSKNKYWEWASPVWAGYYAKHGGPDFEFYGNKHYELRRVVQASASAPFFLSPIEKQISEKEVGLFFDGGVSPHNNPAMQAFLVATAKWRNPPWDGAPPSPWGFGWNTGPDNLMVISLGTGAFRPKFQVKDFKGKWAGVKALDALRGMIPDTSTNGLTWLQAMSDPPFPTYINSEIDDMAGLSVVNDPLLHFQRLDVDLDEKGLTGILTRDGFEHMLTDYPKEGKEGLIKDLRELANSADTNMSRLELIGDTLGQYWFGKDALGRLPKMPDGENCANPADLILPPVFDT